MAELWEKTKDYSYKASYVLSVGAIIYVMVILHKYKILKTD